MNLPMSGGGKRLIKRGESSDLYLLIVVCATSCIAICFVVTRHVLTLERGAMNDQGVVQVVELVDWWGTGGGATAAAA